MGNKKLFAIICDFDGECAVKSSTSALFGNMSDLLYAELKKENIVCADNGIISDDDNVSVLKISPCVVNPVELYREALKYSEKNIVFVNGNLTAGILNDKEKAKTVDVKCDVIRDRLSLHKFIESRRIAVLDELYNSGVDIPCYDGVEISPAAKIEPGAVILSGTKIDGHSSIGKDSVIGPNSVISESDIGSNSVIEQTKVTKSVIDDNVKIGPYCQIRPNCHIKSGVKIGDFVEVKNSLIGCDTHASHLTYIGDSDIGERVNFGCGTVTSNYDGIHKFRTTVGNDAFIGCNTNLVAPVKIGNLAYTAAGSTITKDVPDGALAVARERQTVIEGWAAKRKKEK